MFWFICILIILFIVWVYELNSTVGAEKKDKLSESEKKPGAPVLSPEERLERAARIGRLMKELESKEAEAKVKSESESVPAIKHEAEKSSPELEKVDLLAARESDFAREIKTVVEKKAIPYLVHFTQAYNIPNIISNGLLTRSLLEETGSKFVHNDALRLDGVKNSISLSVGFPNYKMFYKYRCSNPGATWVVLIIDKSVLWENSCLFCKHNAADKRMIKNTKLELVSTSSFESMYDDMDGIERDLASLFTYDPTDPQAEILSLENISYDKINAYIFDSYGAMKEFDHFYPGKNSYVDSSFFSSREYSRKRRIA
jgi:hypothetical protein